MPDGLSESFRRVLHATVESSETAIPRRAEPDALMIEESHRRDREQDYEQDHREKNQRGVGCLALRQRHEQPPGPVIECEPAESRTVPSRDSAME